jgi:two-component system, NtrC family, sensor histidine kinase GlrK
MLILSRLSFRQFLLAAFLLIAALLSATSVHALLTLERLVTHSRESARDAVQLTENAQRLAERTVAMERSARQFMVLDDPVFRDRFSEAWQDARTALASLSVALPDAPPDQFAAWTRESEAAWSVLQAPRPERDAGRPALDQAFARLPAINAQLTLEGKRATERHNNALLAELERQRGVLTVLVVGAVVLAALLAFGFGVWLSRPLTRIETAIGRLGENRFDQTIEVHGPADLRRLGEQLDWLRRRLADLESDKARFLRHISHELKTPLAALCEGVALLQDEVVGALSEPQREIAHILQQNTVALQMQIEDLLRYNAATFDAQHLRRVPLDLRTLLQQVIDSQRLQWQARGLRVETTGAGGTIAGDADKLAIVLGNLLSNAVRFSPDGGVIRFILSAQAGRLRIDCLDDGPGVAPADIERVFEPFYQGTRQPPGARRGSGIGLSIVREYVEAHGGTVQLMPHGGGAHFRIELVDEN